MLIFEKITILLTKSLVLFKFCYICHIYKKLKFFLLMNNTFNIKDTINIKYNIKYVI